MSNNPQVTAASIGAPYAVTLKDHIGHQWLADEPLAAGGGNEGPGPHALLLSSLGACTAITLRMYAACKSWALTGVEVEVAFNPDGAPADGANEIRRRITLHGDLDAEQRARLLEVANKCPIHRVLTGAVRIPTTLSHHE